MLLPYHQLVLFYRKYGKCLPPEIDNINKYNPYSRYSTVAELTHNCHSSFMSFANHHLEMLQKLLHLVQDRLEKIFYRFMTNSKTTKLYNLKFV